MVLELTFRQLCMLFVYPLILLLHSFFFFICFGNHRDLHSFPTRRSSDLVICMLTAIRLLLTFVMSLYLLLKSNRYKLDRKSGSAGMPRPISYAVFCLKKKKYYQKQPCPV